MRFTNKVVLVTCGGRGIGRATCLAFAREGADVAVADFDLPRAEAVAQEVRATGKKGLAVRVDVTDPASTQAMVTQTVTALGAITILVNSAGVREIIPFLEL